MVSCPCEATEARVPGFVKPMTDNLKNIDKATRNMKTDRAKHNRLAKEMVKGVTAGLGAVAMLRDLGVELTGDATVGV